MWVGAEGADLTVALTQDGNQDTNPARPRAGEAPEVEGAYRGRPVILLGLSSPYLVTTTPASGGRGDFSVHRLSPETQAAPAASLHHLVLPRLSSHSCSSAEHSLPTDEENRGVPRSEIAIHSLPGPPTLGQERVPLPGGPRSLHSKPSSAEQSFPPSHFSLWPKAGHLLWALFYL